MKSEGFDAFLNNLQSRQISIGLTEASPIFKKAPKPSYFNQIDFKTAAYSKSRHISVVLQLS